MQETFFRQNRKKLTALLHGETIVITANGLQQSSADMTHSFRQDSNFYYLTGLRSLNDAILVMHNQGEFLILPKQSEAEHIFGGQINCDKVAETSGIIEVLENKIGWDRHKKMQQNRNIVKTILPSPKKVVVTDSFYTNPARMSLVQKLRRSNPKIVIEDISTELKQLRMIKQPCEIQAIKQAIEITANGIADARKIIKPGVFEFELEAELDFRFKKSNTTHAFEPIISYGDNACILHNLNRQSKIGTDQFLLFDVGADYQGYSADISRTYAIGKVSQRHQQVYESVKKVHEYAISLLKANITWREWVLTVDDFMGEQLIELGLIRANNRKNVHKFFSHGIGHSLGLDAHDVCDYKIIKENMVITVEPGIYIKEESIGVRIEDDILITKDGAINLSVDIPYI